MMFRTQRVETKCTLSLAKPLCYARGTVLPCFLTLESSSPQALDLLCTPSAIALSLRRRVRFYNKPSSSRQDVAWNESMEDTGRAVWWPSTAADARSDSNTRYLEGEIRLEKDLRPTSEMGHFSIFDSTALLSEPVEIATMHPKGPRTNAYSPPAYDSSRRHAGEERVPTFDVGAFF
ncbi:hypothetical protein NLJ89_g3107 [Agrocybe chaxingu]|uniref:Uncharacterized protein n=1 Tax=Agrocybe chaxingu TaxID=84603 RepID=A0A9W8KAB2_9AGAR|nr:hypothetical protein NLJ89_g3107 [Agrocybe chaxingu]